MDEQTQEQPQETEAVELDAKKLSEELESLKSQNERLLAESKKYKQRAQSVETQQEKLQREALEKEGKFQELLEMEKSNNQKVSEQMMQIKRSALQKEIKAEVARYAKDAFDVEDIIKNLDSSLLEVDEDSLTVKGIDKAVAVVRENKKYLFSNPNIPSFVNSRPNDKIEKKSLSDMSKEEKQKLLKGLIT